MATKKIAFSPDAHPFEFKGAKYKVLVPSCIVPGFNKNKPLTALEITTDANVQAYLVEVAKAVDTVIELVEEAAAPVADPAKP